MSLEKMQNFCQKRQSSIDSHFRRSDSVQPVDAGFGRVIKCEAGEAFEEWLEDEENLTLWEHGHLSASQKRILITKFVGSAWEKTISRTNTSTDIYFQRTGCLLTLDGSEDHLVKVEGIPEYRPHFVQVNDDDDDELPAAADNPESTVESDDNSDLHVGDMQHGEENGNIDIINV